MDKIARLFFKKPLIPLIILLIIIGSSIFFVLKVRYDNSPDSFFLKNDFALIQYNDLKDTFGSDEYAFVVLDSPETWTQEYVNLVEGMTDSLVSLDHVLDVTSIFNVRKLSSQEDALLVEEFKEAFDDIKEAKIVAVNDEYYRGLFINKQGTKIGVVIKTELIANNILYKKELTDQIREILHIKKYEHLNPVVVGAPIIDADVFFIVSNESNLFGTLSFIIVAIAFYLMFRNWVGVVVPLTVVTLTIIMTGGLMGMFDFAAGILTPIVPGFLISVGVGSSVFYLHEIFQRLANNETLESAVISSFSRSLKISFLSVSTTALALFAFATSSIKPVEQLGFTLGFGLLFSYIITVLFIPVFFSYLNKFRLNEKTKKMYNKQKKKMKIISVIVAKKWKGILLLTTVICAAAFIGITKVKIDYHYIGMFKKHTDIYQSYTYIDETLRGAASLELVMNIKESSDLDFTNPQILNHIEKLQNQLEQKFPQLNIKTYGVVDIIKEINKTVNGNNPEYYKIPNNSDLVDENLILFESSGGDEVSEYIEEDYRKTRLNISLKYRPESEYTELFSFIDGYKINNIDIVTTGVVALWSQLNKYLSDTELVSILLSSLIVLLAMVFISRSFSIGFIMLLCNLIPIYLTISMMGLLDIFIDPYTMLVAAIAIGILDDDTIHIVSNFYRNMKSTSNNLNLSLERTYSSSGLTVILLSLVLVSSFAIYLLSDVNSLAKFGTMTCLAILIGGVSEFFITPSILIAITKYREKRENV